MIVGVIVPSSDHARATGTVRAVAQIDGLRIRRIRADEGLTLREMRLRSLADSPDAFGQRLDEARHRPSADWQHSARQSAQGESHTWFFAELNGQVVGIVQGRKRRPRTLLLFSMWVDPSGRRIGLGSALISELEDWARHWGATETVLWVYGGNARAIEFYRDLGFEANRDEADIEAGGQFGAISMRRDIGLPAPSAGNGPG